jgi:putative endonuclease
MEYDTAMSNTGRRRKGAQQYFVYILASRKNGTLYVGVTSDLVRRVHEHKHDLIGGFTKAHQIHRLVYYETTDDVAIAIKREKQLKRWRRDWKLELVARVNPEWKDIYPDLL